MFDEPEEGGSGWLDLYSSNSVAVSGWAQDSGGGEHIGLVSFRVLECASKLEPQVVSPLNPTARQAVAQVIPVLERQNLDRISVWELPARIGCCEAIVATRRKPHGEEEYANNRTDSEPDTAARDLHWCRPRGRYVDIRVAHDWWRRSHGLAPNGSRLSCGRLARRRKSSGRPSAPDRAQTLPFP